MGDLIQSIGVIIAAIIMKIKPEWLVIDPICTFMFSVLVLATTIPIFRECVGIVLESAPNDIDIVELFNDILYLNSVQEIHDFHCWTLGGGKFIMTCHVRSRFRDKALRDINKIAKQDKYGIFHSTIQVEKESELDEISCDCNN